MAITQGRSRKKPSGGLIRAYRSKRKFEKGNSPTMTKIGQIRSKKVIIRGKKSKMRILSTEYANLLDKKTNKYEKAKITTVVESAANRHYVRRNIITKGTVIMTDKGKAVVTSKPGSDGMINAVLVFERSEKSKATNVNESVLV